MSEMCNFPEHPPLEFYNICSQKIESVLLIRNIRYKKWLHLAVEEFRNAL
jgi:hypothetical protein